MLPFSPAPGRMAGRMAAVAACLFALVACDIPTELPQWDTRWVIPAERTAFSVAELLPAGIALAEAGEFFEVPLGALTLSRSLREICPECAPLAGLTVPKPPFTVTFGGDLQLPDELLSATLAEGAVQIRVSHDFPFDPLRPSAAGRGYLVLSVTSGSTLLARDSLDGRTTALPPGGTVERTLRLTPGQISAPLQVGITLHSPAGDPVRIDPDDRLTLAVPAADVRLAGAVVRIDERTVRTPEIELELGQVDGAIADRVQEGALRLAIENPFDITGSFELRITTPSGEIVQPVEITPGESLVRVALTGDELRSMLGQDEVGIAIVGTVSSPSSGTELAPEEEIAITARLELVVSTTRE